MLTNGGSQPNDVAIDPNGYLAVSNATGPALNCFAPGASSPTRSIGASNFVEIYYQAFDSSGNLFVVGQNLLFNTQIGEVLGGCPTGSTVTNLTTSNSLVAPGDVGVAKNGTIVVGDPGASPPTIYTYKSPSGNSLKLLDATPLLGAEEPVGFALTPGLNAVLVADFGLGQANLYGYPAGGAPIRSVALPAGGPEGAAIVPDEEPMRR